MTVEHYKGTSKRDLFSKQAPMKNCTVIPSFLLLSEIASRYVSEIVIP